VCILTSYRRLSWSAVAFSIGTCRIHLSASTSANRFLLIVLGDSLDRISIAFTSYDVLVDICEGVRVYAVSPYSSTKRPVLRHLYDERRPLHQHHIEVLGRDPDI